MLHVLIIGAGSTVHVHRCSYDVNIHWRCRKGVANNTRVTVEETEPDRSEDNVLVFATEQVTAASCYLWGERLLNITSLLDCSL